MTCGKYKVSPDTGRATRAGLHYFKHPVVYDAGTGAHVHCTPIPDDKLDQVKRELGGSLEPLGHIWPLQVAQDISNSVCHPVTRVPFTPLPGAEVRVPRGGQAPARTAVIGGRLEQALRTLPPPEPMVPEPVYDAVLARCGVTEKISPIEEIPEDVLVKVLKLRECDVAGADLLSGRTRTEAQTLTHFVETSDQYTMKEMQKWLQTRHLSRTKMSLDGRTQVCFIIGLLRFRVPHTHVPYQ